MPVATQTLNQYIGTDAQGVGITIVAPDMTTACQVYQAQENDDPNIMQCTKRNIACVLPEIFVSFTAEAYDPTGTASNTCYVTPGAYTLKAGDKQIFTAKAGEGWEFEKWMIGDVDVEDEEGNLVTDSVAMLTIPSSNVPIVIKGCFKAST